LGPQRKKEETLALISEENVRKNPAKPWISNRQLSVGSGTVLTFCMRRDSVRAVEGAMPRKFY
jgi:hypothetical protein